MSPVPEQGRVLFLNRFALNLLGYSKDEMYGRNAIGTILTRKEAETHYFNLASMDTFELPISYVLNENENLCKGRRQVYIQWDNKTITDDKGRLQRILSIGTNITQRRELETSLCQARKRETTGTLAGGTRRHDTKGIFQLNPSNYRAITLLVPKITGPFSSPRALRLSPPITTRSKQTLTFLHFLFVFTVLISHLIQI